MSRGLGAGNCSNLMGEIPEKRSNTELQVYFSKNDLDSFLDSKHTVDLPKVEQSPFSLFFTFRIDSRFREDFIE